MAGVLLCPQVLPGEIRFNSAIVPTKIISPKQPSSPKQRDWYPYYAGFTEGFVEAVLSEHVRGSGPILDPWSGSGTTTAACAKRGIESMGVDVNPALTVLARARLTPVSTKASLLPLAARILKEAKRLHSTPNASDLLEQWMRADAVRTVRSIQDAIHLLLTNNHRRPRPNHLREDADELPLLACFFYSALFASVREFLARFGTTNPTWLKTSSSYRQRIAPKWNAISKVFLNRVEYLRDRLSLIHDIEMSSEVPFRTASATSLPFASGTFSAALTSPPYATRIDYVRGTLPELATLGADEVVLAELRKETTGTPVITGDPNARFTRLTSECAVRILDGIGSHPSKGSRSYYLPWMRSYLLGLQTGLSETARTVGAKGTICIVVQDSYYKELRIDLQRIVTEILDVLGRNLVDRRDYPANNLRSRMNPRALRHAKMRSNTESLLVFS